MSKTISAQIFFVAFSLAVVPMAAAEYKKVDKDKAQKDFEEWHAETKDQFEKSWAGKTAAEEAVKPLYEKGVKLAKEGKDKAAIKALLKARAALFNGDNARFVHVNKGLSFQIATALAEIYEKQENGPQLKQETFFMDKAREWLPKEEEEKVYLRYAIKELYRVYGVEENKPAGKGRMKSKERKRLFRIMSHLVVGTSDVISQEGYELGNSWKKAAEDADKTIDKDVYEDFGGQGDVEDYYEEMAPVASNFPPEGNVLIINRTITHVTKKGFAIDLRAKREVPVNCKSTGKILEFTPRGRAIYKQKCDFIVKEGGHKLSFKNVKGLKLKPGDNITMYAPVIKPVPKKKEVKFGAPAVVHVSRKGKTKWLLGVKTDKPAHIKADGDFHILLQDDGEAPPKVK